MKAPTTLKEALRLALEQQELIEHQQEKLERQERQLADASAQRTGRPTNATFKLAATELDQCVDRDTADTRIAVVWLGISKQAMFAIERGNTKTPNANVAQRLAEELKVTVAWILYGTKPEPVLISFPDNPKLIGSNLREIRIAKGLSLHELAEISGLSIVTLDDVESGNVEYGEAVERVAQTLGVALHNLYMRHEVLSGGPEGVVQVVDTETTERHEGLDRARLHRAVKFLSEVLSHHQVTLKPEEYADALGDVYELFVALGDFPPYGRMMDLVYVVLARTGHYKPDDTAGDTRA